MPVTEGLTLFGSTAFLLGFVAGRFSETHKEYLMDVRTKVRAWFDRWALTLYSVVAVMALAGILLGVANSNQNGRDLVTSCENANESRAATRALWEYIIDQSTANQGHLTPTEQRTVDGFRSWVETVYAAHDCSDLSKKYPLPPPPPVVKDRR